MVWIDLASTTILSATTRQHTDDTRKIGVLLLLSTGPHVDLGEYLLVNRARTFTD